MLLELFVRMMKCAKFEVIGTANDGDEAVIKFKQFPLKPQIILLDYRLPLKTGLEVMKEIHQIDPTPKVIFITADDKVRSVALANGAVDFKIKPFTYEHLISNIKQALKLPPF